MLVSRRLSDNRNEAAQHMGIHHLIPPDVNTLHSTIFFSILCISVISLSFLLILFLPYNHMSVLQSEFAISLITIFYLKTNFIFTSLFLCIQEKTHCLFWGNL